MPIIKLLFHPFFLDFTIVYLRRVMDSANEMAFPEMSVLFGTLNQCPPWPLSSASPAWNSLGVSAGSCQDVPVWTFSSPWLLWWWMSSIGCASPTARPQGAETNLPPVSVRFPSSVSCPYSVILFSLTPSRLSTTPARLPLPSVIYSAGPCSVLAQGHVHWAQKLPNWLSSGFTFFAPWWSHQTY